MVLHAEAQVLAFCWSGGEPNGKRKLLSRMPELDVEAFNLQRSLLEDGEDGEYDGKDGKEGEGEGEAEGEAEGEGGEATVMCCFFCQFISVKKPS